MMRSLHSMLGGTALLLVACGTVSHSDAPNTGQAGTDSGGSASAGGDSATAGQAGSRASGGSSSGSSPIDVAGAAGAGSDCGPEAFAGLSVFASGGWDPLGYPPYALDGCMLVYVAPTAPGATTGALFLRDLSTGQEILLETATLEPRRPAIAGDLIAWEARVADKSQVRVRYQGQTRDVAGDFVQSGEPRVTADAVVFTAFLGTEATADTDVFLYDPIADKAAPVAAGPGQQRFADISHDYVAVTDFSEDPRGYFDEAQSIADILLVERATGKATSRPREGKQAFPLLGDSGALVYLDWGAVHPEPKFSQFSLRAGDVTAAAIADVDLKGEPVQTNPAYVRPSLRGLNVDFIDTQNSVGLYRVVLGTGAAPVLTPIAGAAQLFGPVAADELTLVSQPLAGQTLKLTAVAR
ncbi:MAG TPA: hypothetical protein VHB79_38445 [Polyangiaceae bacterium]|nr:hypothetical protein [Polyangiaceae bacterium]